MSHTIQRKVPSPVFLIPRCKERELDSSLQREKPKSLRREEEMNRLVSREKTKHAHVRD
jgi:hypothetical protein